MRRKEISELVKRRLYAESIGQCMNPRCQKKLFIYGGDIAEKAHIIPYSDTEDNSFENLLLLCPNCHTDFDKNSIFSPSEVRSWKELRRKEIEELFCKKFRTFNELKAEVVPLLEENRIIFESYYLNDQKQLWNKFESKILTNNYKLKLLLSQNLTLFQSHSEEEYSNIACIQTFLLHIDEFEATRQDKEKTRCLLFPEEINSIFGLCPIHRSILPSTESLEAFIQEISAKGRFVEISIGISKPYIQILEDGKLCRIYLDDTPRLRQLYFDHNCFRKTNVRFDSLNYALIHLRNRGLDIEFPRFPCLREIIVKGIHIIFVYEYCLSKAFLLHMSPENGCVIVNLHRWNGNGCISNEAHEASDRLKVQLLTMEDFYAYVNGIN